MNNLITLPSYGGALTETRVNSIATRFDDLAEGVEPAYINVGDPAVMKRVNGFLKWMSEQDWSHPVPVDKAKLNELCGQPKTPTGSALRACLTEVGGGRRLGVKTYAKNKLGLKAVVAALSTRIKVETVLAKEAERVLRVRGAADEALNPADYRPRGFEEQYGTTAIVHEVPVAEGSYDDALDAELFKPEIL